MKSIKILLGFLSLILCTCVDNSDTKQFAVVKRIHSTYRDEINKISPVDSLADSQKKHLLGSLKQYERSIQLRAFHPQTDSVLVRVWINIGLNIVQYVVEFGIRNDTIDGRVFEYATTEKRDSLAYVKEIKTNRLIDWDLVLREALQRRILLLPDMEALTDVPQAGGDGADYCIEIFSKKTYRFYSYWCPFGLGSKNPNLIDFVKFMRFLKKTLGLIYEEC
jgi:hypothetical protein